MDEDGSELIRCYQCFMQIPQENVFQSIRRCRVGRSVSGQGWIDVQRVILWWKRKGGMRCIWRYVEVYSDRYKGQGQGCRRMKLFVCPAGS